MIFFDYYFKASSTPKYLEPVAVCMERRYQVLMADEHTLKKFIAELKSELDAIPKAEERFSFHVSEGSLGTISVYKNNSQQKCMLRIAFSDVRGMFGFDSSQESIQPVPDDGDEYYSLPDHIKSSVQKGGAK